MLEFLDGSIGRLLDNLNPLVVDGDGHLTVSELARRTGLARSSLQEVLQREKAALIRAVSNPA